MISFKAKAFLVILTALSGSGFAAYQAGIISVPEFGVEDRGDWTEVSDERIGIESTAGIENDNPVSFNLSRLEVKYKLNMNGIRLAEGLKKGIAIREGNQSLKIESYLYQQKIPQWWISHIRNDEQTNVKIDFSVRRRIFGLPLRLNGISYSTSINTDLESTLDKAMKSMEGNYSGPDIAGIEGTGTEIKVKGGSAEFGKVTKERTTINAEAEIENPNPYPVPTPRLSGAISLNDVDLANITSGPIRSLDKTRIDPGETETLEFKASIDNQKIDNWLVEHIKDGERSGGQIDLFLVFELNGVSFKIPTASCGFNVQTGIFVDGQNSTSSFGQCDLVRTAGTGGSRDSSGNERQDSLDARENESADLNPIPGDTVPELL
ncbi:hypothetical protein [Candidatus Nanohalococcus occultus]|uniref:LEA14-like dessication related protein n=1 Tax=Candidatus Nanohalococcus occultus TaxID=2978047 RepID=A0ABY8CII3_9ARCH|nr:LEA14-like dessication related protein [Candidatus Nanohaloarchaeota archaeon SVXNc]